MQELLIFKLFKQELLTIKSVWNRKYNTKHREDKTKTKSKANLKSKWEGPNTYITDIHCEDKEALS